MTPKQDFLAQLERAKHWVEPEDSGEYDPARRVVHMSMRANGTTYEGRLERIERVRAGDSIRLVREKNNPHDEHCINIRNARGETLGLISPMWSRLIAPMVDWGLATLSQGRVSHVVPKSQRGRNAKAAKLQVDFDIHFVQYAGEQCTVCFLGGDQTNVWAQKLEVVRLNMPASAAALLFEIYNRIQEEYDDGNNDVSYIGLSNLAAEVTEARHRMRASRKPGVSYTKPAYSDNDSFREIVQREIRRDPKRYAAVDQHLPVTQPSLWDGHILANEFRELLMCCSDDVQTFYWCNQTRVGPEEYGDSFSHWYDIAELFEGDLPVNLNDEEVVSILGTGRFTAFADLSYGC